MSTDWREKEREFLASLESDTGRDLGQWMALISSQGLPHRNDIIDWLRRQGFMFSRASWLERIHHNGGQPIYITAEELAGSISLARIPSPIVPAPSRSEDARSVGTTPPPREAAKPAVFSDPEQEPLQPSPPSDPAPAEDLPPATEAEVAEVIGKAKAYRPLAAHLLRSLQVAIPDLVVAAGPSHLSLARNRMFGLLAVSGKDLRLAVALGARPFEAPLEPVKLPVTLARSAQGLTHMIVLTDARQVDGRLVSLVKSAAGSA